MNTAGRFAADTLGFMVGDFGGALAADRIYQRYRKDRNLPKNSKEMAKRKAEKQVASRYNKQRKRKRTGRGKKAVSSASSSSGRNSYMFSSGSSVSMSEVGQNPGNSLVVRSIRRKGGKVAKEGIKKTIKVPRLLRKQIKQALTPYDHCGTFIETQAFKYIPTDFGQSVFSIGRTCNGVKQCFDPTYVNHAASVLFNNKAGTATPFIGNSGMFDTKTAAIKVISQNEIFRFKNNTARTMFIKLYAWSPKGRMPVAQDDFVNFWIETMKNEEGSGLTSLSDRRNINNATPATLYANPFMCKVISNHYTVDCTTIVLEAGKEYNHKLVGPNMKTYDFSKYWDPNATNADFQNQQSFVKGLALAVYYDLAAATTGAPTRSTAILANGPFGLVVEQTSYIKVCQPELTGYKNQNVVLAGSTQQMTNRKVNPYYLMDWTQSGAIGATQLVNDNTPNVPATAGV